MKLMHQGWHGVIAVLVVCVALSAADPVATFDPTQDVLKHIATLKVGDHDWPQWGGSPSRNNTPDGKNVPAVWDVKTGKNIKWSMPLGSETYGNPIVANGKVYVGTNNGAGYLKRYPSQVDLGALLCFDAVTGKFLWQHSSEKLPTGRVHDWPNQGICSAPMIEGDRLWYVTSRGEVVCLDTNGFQDDNNAGPFVTEPNQNKDEADVVWSLDMMSHLGVSQHNMCSCSVTAAGDLLFVNTSNGVDESHITIPRPAAPSFICVDKTNGKVLWTDNSPGRNVLHGQWSSPAYSVLGGEAQVIFGGGDGWLYSFATAGENGKAKLLWKFDCNPKDSLYLLGGRATRNHIIATPVIYDGLVYVAVGEDPEHGEGVGHLWCVDPTKRGDVSPAVVYNSKDPKTPIAHKRLQALVAKDGDFARENANSAVVWHYEGSNPDQFESSMHRSCGTVAIKDGLLFIADFSGLMHCMDAKSGKPFWTHDMFAASWASPLIVDGKVYIGDEDGDISIFRLSKQKEILAEINMGSAVYTTPILANNLLYIANRNRLFAIQDGASSPPPPESDSATTTGPD
ncbi:MAG: PQQ-binding-like beta-propeller repeat protein [Planctomycetota bacterium]|nr:PQQ-binding-like beta-propeller repeat protein [Planctomycetota bacterium]